MHNNESEKQIYFELLQFEIRESFKHQAKQNYLNISDISELVFISF